MDWRELKDILPISKTAFYNAISRLKADGDIDWEAPEGILVSVRDHESQSMIADSQSTIADSQSTIAESQSTIADSLPLEPIPEKKFKDRPDYIQFSNNFNFTPLTPQLEGGCSVLKSFEESLKKIGLYFRVYRDGEIIDNPRMKPILRSLSQIAPDLALKSIRAFLNWAKGASNVKDIYKAFHACIKKRWQEQ